MPTTVTGLHDAYIGNLERESLDLESDVHCLLVCCIEASNIVASQFETWYQLPTMVCKILARNRFRVLFLEADDSEIVVEIASAALHVEETHALLVPPHQWPPPRGIRGASGQPISKVRNRDA